MVICDIAKVFFPQAMNILLIITQTNDASAQFKLQEIPQTF